MVRNQALRDCPGLAPPLLAVGAKLDNPVMQELNRQVDQDGEEPREVAARFLQRAGPRLMRWTARNLDTIGTATLTIWNWSPPRWPWRWCVALPLGLLVARRPGRAPRCWARPRCCISLPTLAVFALLVPVLGLGFWPALVALVTYAVPILLRALVAGLASAAAGGGRGGRRHGADAAAAAVAGGIAAGAAGAAGRVAGGLRHAGLGGDGRRPISAPAGWAR